MLLFRGLDYLVRLNKKDEIQNLFFHYGHSYSGMYYTWVRSKYSYFILAVDEWNVAIMAITPLGKIRDDIIILPYGVIQRIKIKKKIFGYKLTICLYDGKKEEFIIRPYILGYKDQAEEVKGILNLNRIFFDV